MYCVSLKIQVRTQPRKKNESKFNVSEDIFIFIRHLSNLYCINYNVACAFLSLHKLNEHQVSGKSHDEKVVYTRIKCLSIFNTQTCVCVCEYEKKNDDYDGMLSIHFFFFCYF